MKMWRALVVVVLLSAYAEAQETTRQVEGEGKFSKYLTPNLVDSWIINGEKGETIVAYVSSSEFDPVLELAKATGGDDKILITVDDDGSESRFSTRLPAKGEFKIRVHAFKYKGGGNYTLRLRRFQAKPVEIGKTMIGTFDRNGRSHHYFRAKKDQILITRLVGSSSRAWEMLDTKGRRLTGWSGTVLIEDAGENSLVVTGGAGNRYELKIDSARVRTFDGAGAGEHSLERGGMDVWSFDAKPGDFRLLEVASKGRLNARLIYAPREKVKDRQRLSRQAERPEIQRMPVASKGGRVRFVATLGREGRYQLQLMSASPTSYRLQMKDPTQVVQPGQKLAGKLAVGGASFYSFRAQPGQLLVTNLASSSFDPLLRLYDARGDLVEENDDGGGEMGSRVSHMVRKKGEFRLQVGSVGDGGGGEFTLALHERKLSQIKVGARNSGVLQQNSTDFWSFQGQEGKTIFVSVRSSVCDPSLSLHSPDGVHLGGDDNSGTGTDALLAIRLPKTGRYTIWISSGGGTGDYNLRIIDAD